MTITVGAALQMARAELQAADAENPMLDARLLIAHALAVSTETVIGWPEREIDETQARRIREFTTRRSSGEPVAYIIGEKEFWRHRFIVSRDTLIPRPESETLIEAVLATHRDRTAPLSIADLGTGTGCLLLSLLGEFPRAQGVGIDVGSGAIEIAKQNAERHGLADRANWRVGDWSVVLGDDSFDVIVSNPPYVERDAIAALRRDVAMFEPHRALDGGSDGLDGYRSLAPCLAGSLASTGYGVLEIGLGQAAWVKKIMQNSGLKVINRVDDLASIPRVLLVQRLR